jgi:serine/threonine protein phosphatase PrpC
MTEIGSNTASHSVAIPGAPGGTIELSWGVATNTGHRRKHNEDSYVATPPLFAVADGMGGHSAGDLASAAVVRRIAEAATGEFAETGVIEGALRLATTDIAAVADEASLGVGTTVTGAALVLVNGAPCWSVFNVGDSRVYLAEGGELSQVTVDHSVVQEMVDAGMISAGDAEHHPDSNIITRAVGFNAEPVPDFWLLPVRAGMRLLLCSDGLSKEVAGGQLAELVTAGALTAELAEELVLKALDAGGRDNITVVVIDVLAAPEIVLPPAGAGAEGDDDEDMEDTVPRSKGGKQAG